MHAKVETRRSDTIDRIGLIALTLVGMAMCAPAIGKVAAAGQWLSVAGILGSALGVLILFIVTVRLLNRRLPLIATDRAAIVAILAIGAIKVATAALA